MAANLLERDQFLRALEEAFEQAREGHGRIAVVSGEAGIGKTSLVERFLERQPGTRVLWGACEALFTPRPLGPLYDIAQQTRAPLRALLDGDAPRAQLFAAALDDLAQSPKPTILVVEDIHWADEATLDLLKFLARRIHRTHTLLVLTYRDDELNREHPLPLLLGDLPSGDTVRLWLPPLSMAAVAALAQQAQRPIQQLYDITGGNPFFLTETLASGATGTPATVRDAVLARMARLSPTAQRLLEVVSVIPNRVEWWVIVAIGAEDTVAQSTTLDECLAAGMMRQDGATVAFRHDLARQAVESALSPTRRRALHADVLRTLLDRAAAQTPLAQLVHHAAQAEDGALVLRFAPEAARQAAAQGAHREAAAHYATALRYADGLAGLDGMRRAELLDGLAYEHYLTGQINEAIVSFHAAQAFWQTLEHQEERTGRDLRLLSRCLCLQGHCEEAERNVMRAIALLEPLPPSRELALAYGAKAASRMAASDDAQMHVWGMRALALAQQFHDEEIESYVLNTIGCGDYSAGHPSGLEKVERSLELALAHGYDEQVARAYANLADTLVTRRDYAEAEGYIQTGITYCAERDLDSWVGDLLTHRAAVSLGRGDWTGATDHLATIFGTPGTALSASHSVSTLIILGKLRARRGDPGVKEAFDEARELALMSNELQEIAPVAAARLEWRWLQGDYEMDRDEAEVAFHLACTCERPWYWGEVAIWLWRMGALDEAPAGTPAPFALEMAGDWRAAAAAWETLGCPYEQALALLGGDPVAQQEALGIFERLGARPAAERTRQRLRLAGVRGLPRGPRAATRANPLGLTPRQVEILLLLAEGLRNNEIAERLSTTPKTVEHHVSAVLAKLEARSRAEAVRIAHELGLVASAPATSLASKIEG